MSYVHTQCAPAQEIGSGVHNTESVGIGRGIYAHWQGHLRQARPPCAVSRTYWYGKAFRFNAGARANPGKGGGAKSFPMGGKQRAVLNSNSPIYHKTH